MGVAGLDSTSKYNEKTINCSNIYEDAPPPTSTKSMSTFTHFTC